MHRTSLLSALLALNGLLIPTHAAPDPKDVKVHSLTSSGNGCPSGSVSAALSADRTLITFIFDSFHAAIGPSIAPAERSQNCQINLVLTYPAGYQFAGANATWRGVADLEPGVTATLQATWYQGNAPPSFLTTVLEGGGEFDTRDGREFSRPMTLPTVQYIYTDCGNPGVVTFNSRIRMNSTVAEAEGSVGLSNWEFVPNVALMIGLAWRTCGLGVV